MLLDEILEFGEEQSQKWEPELRERIISLFSNGEGESLHNFFEKHYKNLTVYMILWGGSFSPDIEIFDNREAILVCYLLQELNYPTSKIVEGLTNGIDSSTIAQLIEEIASLYFQKEKHHFLEGKLLSSLITYLILSS